MQNASGRIRYGERADKSQFLSLCGLDSYLLLFYKICLSGVDTLMVTVHSYILVGRFHARMKICLQECTKEAPINEQK